MFFRPFVDWPRSLVFMALCVLPSLASLFNEIPRVAPRANSNSTLNSTIYAGSARINASVTSGVSSSSYSISATPSSTSSTALGDYVAQGLGIESSLSDASRSSISSSVSKTLATSSYPAFGSSNTTSLGLGPSGITSTKSNSTGNLTYTGDCWAEWNQYWNVSQSMFTATEYGYEVTVSTTAPLYEYTDTAEKTTYLLTSTVLQGSFPQTTYTTLVTSVETSYYSVPTSTVTTITTIYGVTSSKPAAITITPPPCTLPSIVPQCQSSWDTWAWAQVDDNAFQNDTENPLFHADPPVCQQASVTGSLCKGLIDSSLGVDSVYGEASGGKFGGVTTVSTAANGSLVTNFGWDPNQSFAPGCSIGCQTCVIHGGTVQLLYWKPQTAINGTNGTAPVTAIAYGKTLTSPTPYVWFDSLYASDSCSAFGSTYYNEVVAITNTANFSSLYGYQRYNHLGIPASFNFTDLYSTPVPDSIYQSQPRCWSSSDALWPTWPANWTCPRTLPYLPLISLPMEVRQLNPAWKSCTGAVEGLYDPPKALQGTAEEALPTLTPGTKTSMTTTAEPASSVKPTSAPATAQTTAPVTTLAVSSLSQDVPGSSTPESYQSTAQASADPTTEDTTSSSGGDVGNLVSAIGQAAGSTPVAQTSNDDPNGESATAEAASPTNAAQVLSQAQATPGGGQAATTVASGNGDPAQGNSPSAESYPSAGQNTAAAGATSPTTVDGSDQSLPSNDAPGQVESPAPAGTTNAVRILSQAEATNGANTVGQAQTADSSSNDPAAEPSGSSNGSDGPAASNGDQPAASQAVVTIGSQGLTASQVQGGIGAIAIAGSTLTPGQVATLDGTPVSAGASHLVVGGSQTVPLAADSAQAQAATLTAANGQLLTASPIAGGSDGIAIGGTTVAPGQIATVKGIPVSAGTSQIVVSGSQTVPIAVDPTQAQAATFTAGNGQLVTASAVSGGNGAVVVQGNTLSRGGPAQVIDGATLSAGSNGVIVDGSRTIALQGGATTGGASEAGSDTDPSVVHVGSSAFTIAQTQADGSSAVIIANGGTTATLAPGQETTIGGQVISVPSAGGAVIGTDSSAATVSPDTLDSADPSARILTVGSHMVSVVSSDGEDLIIYGSTTATLSAGGSAISVGSEVLTANAQGNVVTATQLLKMGSGTATVIATDNGEDLVEYIGQTMTLSPGGSGVQIGSQALTEVANGRIATAIRVVALGSETATVLATSNGEDVVVLDGTSVTLSPGGHAATVGSQIISEEPNGIITTVPATRAVALGSETATVVATTNGEDLVILDGTCVTLSPGGQAATVGSQVISEEPNGMITTLPATRQAEGSTSVGAAASSSTSGAQSASKHNPTKLILLLMSCEIVIWGIV